MPRVILTEGERATVREAKHRELVRTMVKGAAAEQGLTLGRLAMMLGWPESTMSARLRHGLTLYQFKQIADALGMDERSRSICTGGKA